MTGRATRITLISVTAGVVAIVAAGYWINKAREDGPDFSPPDEPRIWASAEYDKTFSPTPAAPLPDLVESPAPHLEVTRESDELIVSFPDRLFPDTWDQFEIFEPDATGDVTLPGGNRLRLEAIALVRNVDVDWGDKTYVDDFPVEWLDPVTLQPLPGEKTAGWSNQHLRKQNPTALLLRVSNSGEGPLRWFYPRVYDDRTHASAATSSSFDTYAKDSVFNIELLIWHQAPLRISVDFAFGEPEFRNLPVKKEAEVLFGDHAVVRVVDFYPMRNVSSGWGGGGGQPYRTEFRFASSSPERKQRGVIFHLWPPHNHQLIDFKATAADGKEQSRAAWGNYGLFSLNQEGKFTEVDALEVRRFPKMGRAVFELPRIPGLPEVTDLLDAPIPRATFRYDNELRQTIAKGAGLEWQAWRLQNLPDTAFPMTLENSSPREAIAIWEDLIGEPLYFDADTLSIRDEAPAKSKSGRMTGIRKWWDRTKPRWLR